MLAFQPRIRFARKCQSPLTTGEDAGFAQPREPIPVVLARDEELGLHNDHNGGVEDGDTDEALPPPPPAYGLWRSSVVCLSLFSRFGWLRGILTYSHSP